MTPRFQIQLRLTSERGALLRALALAERRGFAVDHVESLPSRCGRHLDVVLGGSEAPPRSPEVLARQLRRLVEVTSAVPLDETARSDRPRGRLGLRS